MHEKIHWQLINVHFFTTNIKTNLLHAVTGSPVSRTPGYLFTYVLRGSCCIQPAILGVPSGKVYVIIFT
jgi:hypothetical protein